MDDKDVPSTPAAARSRQNSLIEIEMPTTAASFEEIDIASSSRLTQQRPSIHLLDARETLLKIVESDDDES